MKAKAERVVFHYNKAHNKDQTLPPWVVKYKGQTYYIHHLVSEVGFSTKETPESEHTKGSLQFRGHLEIILTDEGETHAYVRNPNVEMGQLWRRYDK